MKRLCILVVSLFICGCTVSYSQMMINSSGKMVRCAYYGWGWEGVKVTKKNQENCVQSYRAVGYLEVEKAGDIGMVLNEDEPPTVIKVVNNSPAQKVGIIVGDKVVAVNGQKVKKREEVNPLLFGLAGTPVAVQIMREGIERKYDLILASFVDVYGIPSTK